MRIKSMYIITVQMKQWARAQSV